MLIWYSKLYVLAGAMRLPGNVAATEKPHFLTDAYIQQFNLRIKAFASYDANGLTHIYGFPTEKSSGMYATAKLFISTDFPKSYSAWFKNVIIKIE
jgi:hypothetical protein